MSEQKKPTDPIIQSFANMEIGSEDYFLGQNRYVCFPQHYAEGLLDIPGELINQLENSTGLKVERILASELNNGMACYVVPLDTEPLTSYPREIKEGEGIAIKVTGVFNSIPALDDFRPRFGISTAEGVSLVFLDNLK